MSPAFLLAAMAAAPTAESIAARLAAFAMPDTCDYRMATRVDGPGLSMSSRSHVVQAGEERTWTEVEAAGRRIRMVRDGGTMRVTDLSSGQTRESPVAGATPDAGAGWGDLRSLAWREPRSLGGGRWELAEQGLAVGRRVVVWSETRSELEALSVVGSSGDTVRTQFAWTVVEGRKVPASMDLRAGALTTRVEFSQWSFPRSIPASLFHAR